LREAVVEFQNMQFFAGKFNLTTPLSFVLVS